MDIKTRPSKREPGENTKKESLLIIEQNMRSTTRKQAGFF
jgi:hypothetical protein